MTEMGSKQWRIRVCQAVLRQILRVTVLQLIISSIDEFSLRVTVAND